MNDQYVEKKFKEFCWDLVKCGATLILFMALCLAGDYMINVTPHNLSAQVQSEIDLQKEVNLFMIGKPVSPRIFPWYNPATSGIDHTALEVFLKKGLITQEEFDAFKKGVVLQWKRANN